MILYDVIYFALSTFGARGEDVQLQNVSLGHLKFTEHRIGSKYTTTSLYHG